MRENVPVVNYKVTRNTLLAADVGGTKTLLGLFDRTPTRPRELAVRTFTTLEFDSLASMVAAFLDDVGETCEPIDAACLGVPGPVLQDSATLTSVPWRVDARAIAERFGIDRVRLLNDQQAMVYAVPALQASELHVLQDGAAVPGGNIALIAAGTGLGEALLHHVDGRYVPSPSEGGHADFAARTEREVVLMQDLTRRFGRAEVERVLSGPGIAHIHRALHADACAAGVDLDGLGAAAAISAAAVAGTCPGCVETMDVWVEAYGAEAGNHALRNVATGGLFVGGGIAIKNLPALISGSFMRAFRAKAPMESVVQRIPVKVILNPQAGLLGAAMYAASRHP